MSHYDPAEDAAREAADEDAGEARTRFIKRVRDQGHEETAKELEAYYAACDFFGLSSAELKGEVKQRLKLDISDVTPGKVLEVAMVVLHDAVIKKALVCKDVTV